MAEGEDEEELAQWMPICDDCDKPVEHHCITCGDKLCTGCKDHHLSRRKNRDLQVVLYSAGMRAAQKSKSTCTKHPGERYQLYCKSCQGPVCTPCIAQSHSGHDFISIQEALSLVKEKAMSNLEILTKTIRPRVKNDCENVKETETKVLKSKSTIEKEMRSSAKELHDMVNTVLEENLTQLTEVMETTSMPILRKQKKNRDDAHRKVEEFIKEYENNLRSSDPFDLINYMRGRDTEDLKSVFPSPVPEEIPLPKFQAVSKLQGVIKDQFGSLILPKTGNVTPAAMPQKQKLSTLHKVHPHETENITQSTEKKPEMIKKGKDNPLALRIQVRPEQGPEFTVSTNYITWLGKLRHANPDMIWVSGTGGHGTAVLLDRDGNVLRTFNMKCKMYEKSGMYCTDDGELIFCDNDGKAVKKVSKTFSITTIFTTGNSKPCGICQLQSGDWVICMEDEGVLRVYDKAGKEVRDIGQGHLQRPYYVTVNKVNDDICVSDSCTQVVVFDINCKMRFTYKGEGSSGSGFNPWDLCCDQLGNILITDYIYHCVHIIDRDGFFLQYLVSGRENIFDSVTIDIDDRGHAWVGESHNRKVKMYSYLS